MLIWFAIALGRRRQRLQNGTTTLAWWWTRFGNASGSVPSAWLELKFSLQSSWFLYTTVSKSSTKWERAPGWPPASHCSKSGRGGWRTTSSRRSSWRSFVPYGRLPLFSPFNANYTWSSQTEKALLSQCERRWECVPFFVFNHHHGNSAFLFQMHWWWVWRSQIACHCRAG